MSLGTAPSFTATSLGMSVCMTILDSAILHFYPGTVIIAQRLRREKLKVSILQYYVAIILLYKILVSFSNVRPTSPH